MVKNIFHIYIKEGLAKMDGFGVKRAIEGGYKKINFDKSNEKTNRLNKQGMYRKVSLESE